MILYNFMYSNNLIAADMLFPQSLNYTYFCHKRDVFTWLDHVLCMQHDVDSVTQCSISRPMADNNSDHLPIKITFHIKVCFDANLCDIRSISKKCTSNATATVSWSINDCRLKFEEALQEKLMMIEPM